MAQVPHPRLGELIGHLVRALAGANNWRLGRAVSEIEEQTGYSKATVFRWRQGRLRPPDEILEELARIAQEEAGLDRVWGEKMLRAARYHNVTQLVNQFWEVQKIRMISTNLPKRAHTLFVGREAEMAHLLKLLSPNHGAHLISVDGIGGVGKTALVLEASYRCWRASSGEEPDPDVPIFDAIIFTTARQQHLTPHGILPYQPTQYTLRDIIREMACTLDKLEIMPSTAEEQLESIHKALSRQRTLLIVDNMETMEEQADLFSFLYNLPPKIKVLITTRQQLFIPPIRLAQLSEDEGLRLIQHEAEEKAVLLNDEQALTLYQHVGGVPAAIIYAIGRMAGGYSVEGILRELTNHDGDIARFCFASSVAPLRGQPAHQLLMAAAIFPKNPLCEALFYTAGLQTDPITADKGLSQLKRLSLINQHDRRIGMLPLTREYALAELAMCPEFERELRQRWIEWFMNYVKKYGGYPWSEWHIHYDHIEAEWENFLALLEWCANQERYHDVLNLWRSVYKFPNLYGYWDDRLTWSNWLIEEAEKRADWGQVVQLMCDVAFTLGLIGKPVQLKQADELLQRARHLCPPTDYFKRYFISKNSAILTLRQKQYSQTSIWLDEAADLLKKSDIEKKIYDRERSTVLYYRAEVSYHNKEYEKAKALYREDIEL